MKIRVIDLPGIYSFSTYSMEELVSREFIAREKPDLVVNVIDAIALERNLFFTIQFLELNAPLIIALNQIDLMENKGILIDHRKLGEILGVPVVPTVAIKGKGILELSEQIIRSSLHRCAPEEIKYGQEVEQRIEKLALLLADIKIFYPRRWLAIKLLERDEEITRIVENLDSDDGSILRSAESLADEIENIHGEPCSVVH